VKGDKQSAIASWEVALRHVPASLANNIPAFERALAALKAAK